MWVRLCVLEEWCIDYLVMTQDQKISFCHYLCNQGLLVLPHSSPTILCHGVTIAGLHMVARGLMHSNAEHVIILGYGMKSPVTLS